MGFVCFINRQRDLSGKAHVVDGARKVPRDEISRAIPAPEANAELETSLDVSGNIFFILAHVYKHISVVRCHDLSHS